MKSVMASQTVIDDVLILLSLAPARGHYEREHQHRTVRNLSVEFGVSEQTLMNRLSELRTERFFADHKRIAK